MTNCPGGYRHGIDEFVYWYCSEPRLAFNRVVVLRYRSHLGSRQLAPGTITYAWGRCGALPARLPTAVCSVPIWQLESAASKG